MTREQQILSLASIVHGVARRYPGDKDDLTQAAWVGAIHAVDTWDERTTLHGHAWRCCNWEIAKQLRKQNGVRNDVKTQPPEIRRAHQDDLLFGNNDNHEATANIPERDIHLFAADDRRIETAPARIDTERLLAQLGPRDRAIVTLLGEYSQHEVARALGCGQATVCRIVARTRLLAA